MRKTDLRSLASIAMLAAFLVPAPIFAAFAETYRYVDNAGGTDANWGTKSVLGSCDTSTIGAMRYLITAGSWEYCNGTAWTALGGGGGGPLSGITAATGTNTIANSTNAQIWNWALTGATADAFSFGETTAATGGSGDQSVLKATTLASSTAIPLMVTSLGNGLSLRVNDETGDTDATPFVVDASGNVGIGTTSPAVKLDVVGEVKIGNTAIACSATTEGAFRWNSTGKYPEMCDGTAWTKIIAASGGGTPPVVPATDGYFVITQAAWNGDLYTAGLAVDAGVTDGLTGADALCLDDLTTYDWMGKTDASTRGLLDSAHVKAFICTGSTCNNAFPSTRYYFAVSNDTGTGGAYFDADTSGRGPNNAYAWTASNYFGTSGLSYYSNRSAGTSTLWNTSNNANTTHCTNYTIGTSSAGSYRGDPSYTDSKRWLNSTYITCNNTSRLVCLVHP